MNFSNRKRSFPSRELETKYSTAASPSQIAETGIFAGYASLFNKVDLGQDAVAPGAFRKTLLSRGISGIRMLFQHDPSMVLGIWLDIFEDEIGLYVQGQLTSGVAKADEVRALVKSGALDGLSIGFKTIKSRKNATSGVRLITEVDLWEISVVTFPMLPEARLDASVMPEKADLKSLLPAQQPDDPTQLDCHEFAELLALQTRLKQASNLLLNKQV